MQPSHGGPRLCELMPGNIAAVSRRRPLPHADDEFGGFKGVSRRAAYVIDREGTIRYSYICPDPRDLTNFEKNKQCLREIIMTPRLRN